MRTRSWEPSICLLIIGVINNDLTRLIVYTFLSKSYYYSWANGYLLQPEHTNESDSERDQLRTIAVCDSHLWCWPTSFLVMQTIVSHRRRHCDWSLASNRCRLKLVGSNYCFACCQSSCSLCMYLSPAHIECSLSPLPMAQWLAFPLKSAIIKR